MNKIATDVNVAIKQVEQLFSPVVEAAIISICPALGAPVIKQIVDVFEKLAEDKITKYAETGATFVVIDVQVAQENTRLGRAEAALALAISSGNQTAIAAAKKEFDNAQSALVNDDGSASPQ